MSDTPTQTLEGSVPLQNALTVLMPLNPKGAVKMANRLKTGAIKPDTLNEIGTIHFARLFVVGMDNPAHIPPNTFGLITSYDHGFIPYVQAFVNDLAFAELMDNLMKAAADPVAEELIPVREHAAGFGALLAKYDITNPDKPEWGVWYSAYPTLTVQNIWSAT